MIQKNIEKLNQLGPMPDQSDEEVSDKLMTNMQIYSMVSRHQYP